MSGISSSIAVTSPQQVRAENHKAQTAEWWADPEYQARQAAFLETHRTCAYCGRLAEVVHHDNPRSYEDKAEYYNLERNGTPACHECHRMYRRGYEVCPSCIDHGEVRYMLRGSDECHIHRSRKKRREPRHPCSRWHGFQRCYRAGKVVVCARSAKNARGCDYFVEKHCQPKKGAAA